MVKNLNIPFEDKEKKELERKKPADISWHDYVLHFVREDFEKRKKK